MHSERSVLFYAQANILQKREPANGVSLHQSTQCENIANLNDLQKFCGKFVQYPNSVNQGIYKIHMWFDTVVETLSDDPSISPHKCRIEGDRFSFMMSTTNKLLYIEDIIKLFQDFDILDWDEGYILHPMYIKSFDGKIIRVRPLADRDVVVRQTDMGQIWPVQTNQPPVQLINMLNKQINQGTTR